MGCTRGRDPIGKAGPRPLLFFLLIAVLVELSRYGLAAAPSKVFAGMRGEEPVVTIEVAGTVLAFTVCGLVQIFDDHGAS